MRHGVKRSHLNRDYDHRRALLKNLVRSFVANGFVKTTKPKAVFLRPKIERLVTLAKKGDLSSRRRILADIPDAKLVSKFMNNVKIFNDRKGGYTKLINLGTRIGDRADMVKLSWSQELKKDVEPAKEAKLEKEVEKAEKVEKVQKKEEIKEDKEPKKEMKKKVPAVRKIKKQTKSK